MRKKSYKKPAEKSLKADIKRHLNMSSMSDAKIEKTQSKRIGEIAFIIRDAVEKCSVSSYSGGRYFFNGRYYEYVSKEEFSDALYDIMYEIEIDKGDIVYSGKDIIKIVEGVVRRKILTYEPYKMAFINGVLDTRDNSFHSFSKNHHIFGGVDYNYDPTLDSDEHCYLWLRFLEEVLPESKSRKLLQEFLGMLFLDRNEISIEAMLFMIGKGANGKSVIFKTITGLIGEDNISNYDISDLVNSKDRLLNMSFINGKRLNYCSELSASDINAHTFKSLIAGEPQPARKHYKDPFMAYDIPFMIGNGNSMPPTKDLTDGFFRRVLILPFRKQIPVENQNKNLAYELTNEYPAIFNWIMRGKDRFVKHKYVFTRAPLSEKAILEYKEDNCNVIKWLSDKKFKHVGDIADLRKYIGATYLYKNYKLWCTKFSERPVNMKMFGTTMTSVGFEKRRFVDGYGYLIFGTKEKDYANGVMALENPPKISSVISYDFDD
jgi:P4 family phage/plasmid primase-like protien